MRKPNEPCSSARFPYCQYIAQISANKSKELVRHLFSPAVSVQVVQTAHGCRSSNDAGNHRTALCESHRGTTGSGGWVFVAVALPLHSSAKSKSGPISSMCANQYSNHLVSFGVCRVNPTFQMRASLLHLIASYISYCILLHLIALWRKLKLGCFVVLSLKLLLTA